MDADSVQKTLSLSITCAIRMKLATDLNKIFQFAKSSGITHSV